MAYTTNEYILYKMGNDSEIQHATSFDAVIFLNRCFQGQTTIETKPRLIKTCFVFLKHWEIYNALRNITRLLTKRKLLKIVTTEIN